MPLTWLPSVKMVGGRQLYRRRQHYRPHQPLPLRCRLMLDRPLCHRHPPFPPQLPRLRARKKSVIQRGNGAMLNPASARCRLMPRARARAPERRTVGRAVHWSLQGLGLRGAGRRTLATDFSPGSPITTNGNARSATPCLLQTCPRIIQGVQGSVVRQAPQSGGALIPLAVSAEAEGLDWPHSSHVRLKENFESSSTGIDCAGPGGVIRR